jgi:hypothetical protein
MSLTTRVLIALVLGIVAGLVIQPPGRRSSAIRFVEPGTLCECDPRGRSCRCGVAAFTESLRLAT